MPNYTIQDLDDNLDYLAETKSQIKQALINKGAVISSSDTFRSYVSKINALKVSSENTPLWYFNIPNGSTTTNSSDYVIFNTNKAKFAFSSSNSNCYAGNYEASQQLTPKIGDLAIVNNLYCNQDEKNVVCFGEIVTFSSTQDSNTVYSFSIQIYGGYKIN